MKTKILMGVGALISIYAIYCLYRIPTIADALVIISLVSLLGFILYLQTREVPQKELSPQLVDLNKRIEELRMQKELSSLQMDISRISSALNPTEAGGGSKFSWDMRK